MAAVNWHQRELSGGRVLLTGKVKLGCKHTVQESAQVRNNDIAIAQGKRTVRDLLQVAIANHMETCK